MYKRNFLETQDLFSLISKYVKQKKFDSALDPFMSEFSDCDLLLSLIFSSILKNGTGIVISQKQYESIALITKSMNKNVNILLGSPLQILPSVNDNFDVILSFPPMGIRVDKGLFDSGDLEKIKDDYSNLVILKSLEKLNDDGECIVVLPDSFLIKQNGVRNHLEEFGFYINSVIKLYPSVLRPYTSIIPNIVVISRKNLNGIFVAKYNHEYDKDTFVENWIKRKQSKNPELGLIADSKTFVTVNNWIDKTTYSNELRKYPFNKVKIKDLVKESVLGSFSKGYESFKESPNSLFIPLLGKSNVITKIPDLKIKAQNYIQLVIDEEKALNEYLAGFLNSNLGKQILDNAKTGAIIEKISKRNLELVDIPIPSINQQKEIVHIQSQISQLKTIAQNLHIRLWDKPTLSKTVEKELNLINKGDDIEYLIKNLPFPIASILMKYHREDDIDKKVDYLNYFFEALSELISTIFISSLYSNKSGKNTLLQVLNTEQDKNAIKRTTFGGWVSIASRLAKKIRELMSSNKEEDKNYVQELLKIKSQEKIFALVDKDLYIVLDDVSKKRNDWLGHSAPVTNEESKKRCEILKSNLDRIYDQLFELFNKYELVSPRKEMIYEDGIYSIKVDVIVGSDTNFERKNISVTKPLGIKKLFFLEEGNTQALEVLPFVKLRSSPITALNSCYFYNRTEKDGDYRWLSYHFESESIVTEGDEILHKVIGEII